MRIFLLVSILFFSFLPAYEMRPVGYKSMGMGGVGVASSRGSLAGYFNPALLSFSNYVTEINVNIGIRACEKNLLDKYKQLKEIDFKDTMANIIDNAKDGRIIITIGDLKLDRNTISKGKANDDEDRKNLKKAIDLITDEIGVNNLLDISADVAISAQISDSFAIGLYVSADANLKLSFDSKYNKMIIKGDINGTTIYYDYDADTDIYTGTTKNSKDYENSSIEYAITNGKDYIEINEMHIAELPLSFAKYYDTKAGSLSGGISLKLLTKAGKTYGKINFNKEDVKKINSTLEHNKIEYKDSYAIDLGIAFRPINSLVTLAIVGKNLNSPVLKLKDNKDINLSVDDYKIKPNVRVGISTPILNDNIEFVFDLDLTKNKTLIGNRKTKIASLGVEFHPTSWFAIRSGAMKNIIKSLNLKEDMIWTAGLGFGFKWLQLDMSAMISDKKVDINDKNYPRYMGANIAIVSRWGDGYNQPKPDTIDDTSIDDKNKILTDIEMKELEEELDIDIKNSEISN